MIETHENLLNIGLFKQNYNFSDVNRMTQKTLDVGYLNGEGQEPVKNSIYETKIYRDNVAITHKREIYGIINLLADVGGVLEILVVTFAFFLNSISQHSFYTNSISKLYMAETKDENLFRKKIKPVNLV